jgi:hypothetical protein
MGFVQRFTSTPSQATLTSIEGVNIIDLPVPTPTGGVNTNVTALVGEFADMTYGIACDVNGNITTNPNPVQILSSADLIQKVGGFDSTLGAFGAGCGNGFVELRNKSFGTLVVCPVNLASATGCRFWRSLPTCTSATNPNPVVPVQPAVVQAGYLFTDAAHTLERLKNAQAINFSSLVAYLQNVDGSVTTGSPAATNSFTSATGTFTTVQRPDGLVGVQPGDILVLGSLGATGANLTNAGQFRVVSITNDTTIVVQAMNGVNFDFGTTSAAMVWRLHPGSTADSYGAGPSPNFTSQGTFSVAVRPLTNDAGTGASGSNGTWAASTVLNPVVAPPALTATSADPLSGLTGSVGTTAVAYTALVQAPNAANASAIDALYTAAMQGFLVDAAPASTVSHIWAARKSATIRSSLNTLCNNVSARAGQGLTCSISPELSASAFTMATVIGVVTGSSDPGVGANRSERVFYNWPPAQTFVPEASNIAIAGADGTTVTNGNLDTTTDGWLAAILSNLDPEHNPGEVSATTTRVLQPLIGFGRNVPYATLDINAYKLFRASGICALRFDKTDGPEFQSGVTSSLVNGQTHINRRKMADYIEANLAIIAKPFVKSLGTILNQDNLVTQVTDFLETLVSADNAQNQRIVGYQVDAKSGNTPQMLAAGIFYIIVRVQTIASMDFITFQCEIGESVNITTVNAAPNAGVGG